MENRRNGKSLGLIMALGADIGAATGDMGMWVALGVAIAAAIGVPLAASRCREG